MGLPLTLGGEERDDDSIGIDRGGIHLGRHGTDTGGLETG